ncbi:MAG: hypothetical protein AAFY84_11040 [Pseudomonadota bacterium]
MPYRTTRKYTALGFIMLAMISTPANAGQPTAEMVAKQIEFLQTSDANVDGILTQAELSTALKARFERIDRNDDGVVNTSDAPKFARAKFQSMINPLMAERDANKDGNLTFQEFSGPALDNFKTADGDNDGQVELQALVNALSAKANTQGA